MKKRILLMDDDENALSSTADLLEIAYQNDYDIETISCRDLTTALKRIKEMNARGERIDLAIVDLGEFDSGGRARPGQQLIDLLRNNLNGEIDYGQHVPIIVETGASLTYTPPIHGDSENMRNPYRDSPKWTVRGMTTHDVTGADVVLEKGHPIEQFHRAVQKLLKNGRQQATSATR